MTKSSAKLAIHGGSPTRNDPLPYARQWIDTEDVAAVVEALQSDWLTTGPKVTALERDFASLLGVKEAISVNSGTAALHASIYAIGVKPGDEVIVPTMTFAASVNCIVYQGGTPVFVDIDPDTLLLDPRQVDASITGKSKAVIAVDYAGQSCEYDDLQAIASQHGINLIADACHALGGSYKGHQVGTLAHLNVFSMHPVKHITSGEGGIVTTDDKDLCERMRIFRNHGITSDSHQREALGSWFYEMSDLGYNYRLTDIQCALAKSQLQKLPDFVKRRQQIAAKYDAAFKELPAVNPLETSKDVSHAFHLYVVRMDTEMLSADRATIFDALRAEGIMVNVHYIPVHLHPFYRERFGTAPGMYPNAEAAYGQILSLPIFPMMSETDIRDVIDAVHKVITVFEL